MTSWIARCEPTNSKKSGAQEWQKPKPVKVYISAAPAVVAASPALSSRSTGWGRNSSLGSLMNSRNTPRFPRIVADCKGTRNRLGPVAAAEAGNKGVRKGSILEIECYGVVDHTGYPGWCRRPAFGAASLVEPGCMISSWRPSPSGGTAIRTRTGYRRSASRWDRNDPRVMRHLQVLDSFLTIQPRRRACREAGPRLAARPRAANIRTGGLAADGERRGGESAPKDRGMERPAPLLLRIAAGSNVLAPPSGARSRSPRHSRVVRQRTVMALRPEPCVMLGRSR